MMIYEPFKKVPISEFHEELKFEFPNLAPTMFDYYLVRAAIQMAKTGNLIRRRATLNAEHCVTRYKLEALDDMDICGILSIMSKPSCSGCGPLEEIGRAHV